MIKYTILYKNGKTWNGKAETRADIMVYCWNLIKQKRDVLHVTWIETDGGISVVWPRLSYTGAPTLASSILCSDHYNIRPTRTPNPASVTKKQKKFDKAYVEWAADKYSKAFPLGPGGADCSKQAYKKWLWEQKQAELKSVLKETSLDEFVRVDVPDGFSTSDGWIPWHGGECPVPGDAKVGVKFRCGETNDGLEAGRWGWGPGGGDHIIVAYRLLDEEGKHIKVTTQLPGQIDPVALPITIKLSYDTPIKTTYTFWLGAFGEVD